MTLTPIAVQQRTFATAWRGYDLDEVDDFLDEIVATLAEYERRLKLAKERVLALEARVNEQQNSGQSASDSLIAAQQSADSIVTQARIQAEQIIADSEAQAQLHTQAVSAIDHEDVVAEIDRMVFIVNGLRSQVRNLSESVDDDLGSIVDAAQQARTEAEQQAAAPTNHSEPIPLPEQTSPDGPKSDRSDPNPAQTSPIPPTVPPTPHEQNASEPTTSKPTSAGRTSNSVEEISEPVQDTRVPDPMVDSNPTLSPEFESNPTDQPGPSEWTAFPSEPPETQ